MSKKDVQILSVCGVESLTVKPISHSDPDFEHKILAADAQIAESLKLCLDDSAYTFYLKYPK